MPSPMVVLQVLAPAAFGGLEQVVYALARGQSERGHEVHVVSVVSPGDAETPLHAQLRATPASLHVLELPPRAYLRERALIADLCRTLHPHVFHSHGHRPDVVDAGVARRLSIPTVSTMHGFFHAGDFKGRLSEQLQLAAFRRFEAVVAVSRALRDDLVAHGVSAERVTAIPNAWESAGEFMSRAEARRALGIPEADVVVGWIGRVTRQKALEVAIASLGHLPDIPVSLSLIGDGEERSALEELARTSGLERRIRWHGSRDGARVFMRAFDVFLLCSRWEGTPIVLFEAMAAGVPIVATAVGGVPDVVSTVEAHLVPAGDPQGIAAAVRAVVADPESSRLRVAAASRRLEAEFDLTTWLDRYDRVYQGLGG